MNESASANQGQGQGRVTCQPADSQQTHVTCLGRGTLSTSLPSYTSSITLIGLSYLLLNTTTTRITKTTDYKRRRCHSVYLPGRGYPGLSRGGTQHRPECSKLVVPGSKTPSSSGCQDVLGYWPSLNVEHPPSEEPRIRRCHPESNND